MANLSSPWCWRSSCCSSWSIRPSTFSSVHSGPPAGCCRAAETFTIRNYVRIFQAGFGRFIINSVVICVAATVVSTVLSIMAAYVFSRFTFRFKRTLFIGILFGQVFPWIVLINPLFVAFATMHLINSYSA